MEPKVSITKGENKLIVESPYNTIFLNRAKKWGGKWSGSKWVFDVREETRVRELCKKVFGTDGVCVPDVVSVRATLRDPDDNAFRAPITIFGRVVARAFGRDSGVKIGYGVVILEGGFASGGSVKNWYTVVKGNTVIIVRDVPRLLAEEEIAKGGNWIEIEEESFPIKREELLLEKGNLEARISEISRILGEKDNKSERPLERIAG